MCRGVEITNMNNFWEGMPTEALARHRAACQRGARLLLRASPELLCTALRRQHLGAYLLTLARSQRRPRWPLLRGDGRCSRRYAPTRRSPKATNHSGSHTPLSLGPAALGPAPLASMPRRQPALARAWLGKEAGLELGTGAGLAGGNRSGHGELDEVGCRMTFYI
jgi:hypothetical protein